MRWYLNDLSLQGQYRSAVDFLNALASFLRLRAKSEIIRQRLFCSRMFSQRPAMPGQDCGSIVAAHASREEKGLILAWITKQGPFIDDDRLLEQDDYFEFEGHDVTEQGLGEAARRINAAEASAVVSFLGGSIDFERTPLSVQHGLADGPIGHLPVPNIWKAEDLLAAALGLRADPTSWAQLIDAINSRFDRLKIADTILGRLNDSTFYPAVAKRVLVLLGILQEYMEGRRSDGTAGPRSMELYRQFFTGKRARFSDESDANKHEFKKEMTFRDPDDETKMIFCPWHGKIQTPQFRIHFEWPAPPQQKHLKVMYIGPKITKV